MWSTEQQAARILVVDDNPLILGVIRTLLQSENMDVTTCENGQKALEIIEKQLFDLIICDVMMPVMGGYELYENVRSQSSLYHVPFVFLTALGGEDEKTKGLTSGADDYLIKPFDPKELLALVKGKLVRSQGIKHQSNEQYEKYRRSVLHTLSHEFRTPLVAINTGTELLLERPELEEGKIRNLVEAIQRGGMRLERLVTDFMSLQQIQAGMAEKLAQTKKSKIEAEVFVENLIKFLIEFSNERQRIVHVDRCAPLKRKLNIFETQIIDASARLMDNAIKFSKPADPIELSVVLLGNQLAIRVKDRGVGINPELCQELTGAFQQIDRDKMEQQGSGIGLCIATAYVKYNDSEIEFNTRDGGGTEASIVLPLFES